MPISAPLVASNCIYHMGNCIRQVHGCLCRRKPQKWRGFGVWRFMLGETWHGSNKQVEYLILSAFISTAWDDRDTDDWTSFNNATGEVLYVTTCSKKSGILYWIALGIGWAENQSAILPFLTFIRLWEILMPHNPHNPLTWSTTGKTLGMAHSNACQTCTLLKVELEHTRMDDRGFFFDAAPATDVASLLYTSVYICIHCPHVIKPEIPILCMNP